MVKEFCGWPELGLRVAQLRQPGQVVMALRYQIASELEFYVPGQPQVYCLNAFGRGNQFDLVNDYEGLGGKNVLIVSEGPIPPALVKKFHEMRGPTVVTIRWRGVVVKSFLVYDGRWFDHARGSSLAGRARA